MESGGGGGGGGRAGRRQAAGGGGGGGGWVLVEARLQGGAPWGFTLQGGLEHGEPLIISKVEEGGKADSVEHPLLVGDEIIIINEIELTGFRQEAIVLVKGSYKTLQITVRREFDQRYPEEIDTAPPSLPALPPSSPPARFSPSPAPPQQKQTPPSSRHSRPCAAGGVQLRIKNRRSEASRPHSWHSTKLGEGQPESDKGRMDTMSGAWHNSYHTSASTADLSGGFESGGSYLRKSPDQYSSRGSMESLDPPHSHQLHPGAQHHHPLSHHTHGGPHPAYSSCQQLSSARSSNSIDHLHSKRDSAYSSFSTSSSIPEYLAAAPPSSPERSYSLETVPQRGGGSGEVQQVDARYIRAVSNPQRGLSQEHELSSASSSLLRNSDSRGARGGQSRDLQGSVGGVCYRSSSSSSSGSSSGAPASNRHSVGPIWAPATNHSSYECLKGAPAPPRRSDSYAAIKNHDRPNSWSSLEHARSLRSLQKGSLHHSSGPVASGTAKGSYSTEGQLHTVIEKSPESSPTTKPRQGGGLLLPGSPPGPYTGPTGPAYQSGVYPVPQPEPHYALRPSSSPVPSSTGVYPTIAQDSSRLHQQGLQGIGGRDEEAKDGWRDGRTSATENGYQMNTSMYPHSSSSTTVSTQLRTQTYETDRNQQDENKCGFYGPNVKAVEGGSQGQSGAQRPHSHQGPHCQSPQRPNIHKNQESLNQMLQEHNQDFQIQSRPQSSQEWRDPHALVQSRGDKSRSTDQSSLHPEPMPSPRVAQGQAPPTYSQVPPLPQVQLTSSSQSSPRHHSDSAALQSQQWDQRERDRGHSLTRLDIALAEVQRCDSSHSVVSAGSHGNSSIGNGSQEPARKLSVLEKVSRFERRERAGKQRSHSTSHGHDNATHQRMTQKDSNAPCGAEDLRHMLERSTIGTKAHRTLSYRGGSSDYMKHRIPADPSSALQRSLSSLQLEDSREGDSSKSFPIRQDIQEMLGSTQDTSLSRSYKDSLKDAQSKVLRSTSFRRRDLTSSISSSTSSSHQPQSVLAKQHSLEKKGPKTMPKPQGIVRTPQSLLLVTSPHAPKERHVVGPEIQGPSPPTLPSIPAVGPAALLRICGRKRLKADQKKRSYSEPENINEVGVSDAETTALFKLGGETSVADRRKMFEFGVSANALSRPDLRQLQHNALAEYMERKRGGKRDEEGLRSGARPHSAYLQPGNSFYTDTPSLSSTSSMISLQDSGTDRSFSSGERRTLPPDLWSLQSNLFYPGRVTTPRPPAQRPPSAGSIQDLQTHASSTQDLQDFTAEAGISQQQAAGPQVNLGVSRQLNGTGQKAGSSLSSGKSASAEDLLERSEDRPSYPQHYRSRSSPTVERLDQDFPQGDAGMFGVFIEPGLGGSAAEDRPADVQMAGGLIHPQPSSNSPDTVQPEGAFPASTHTPVTHRDRPSQRSSERQRAYSTSTLAASVGLPCPLSPSGTQTRGGAEWHASERLSLANLDAITFPDLTSTGAAVNHTSNLDTQTRHSLSDASMLEDTTKEMYRGRALSLQMRGGNSTENTTQVSSGMSSPRPAATSDSGSTTSSPPPSSHQSVHQRLSSLRISESSLCSSDQQPPTETSTGLLKEDFDEVFLQNPAPPSPALPIKETDIVEDFPPPPPPLLDEDQRVEQQTVESPVADFKNNSIPPTRKASLHSPPMSRSASVIPQPVPSPLPSLKSQPSTITSIPSSCFSSLNTQESEDTLGLEYQPLPKREKTTEELQVEALARQLVMQDRSLAPLLDTWGGKSTPELVEGIFRNSRLAGKLPWQRRGSSRLDDRIQDGVCHLAQSTAMGPGSEVNLDEDVNDLDSRKVELCEALRCSVAALQQEKEELREEQTRHEALGASIDSLVQELCKTNERDKYSMFIGDLEKIVNLLLSLCSRLSRIDKSLLALQRQELTEEDSAEERDSLHHKRSQLLRQTEDAWELKENLDRRQRVVHAILSGYLTGPQLQDYRHFVSTKPSLLIRQRNLDDLIRQGEEQLTRLVENLPPELSAARDLSRGYLFSSLSPIPCSSPFPLIPGPVHSARPTTVTSL